MTDLTNEYLDLINDNLNDFREEQKQSQERKLEQTYKAEMTKNERMRIGIAKLQRNHHAKKAKSVRFGSSHASTIAMRSQNVIDSIRSDVMNRAKRKLS